MIIDADVVRGAALCQVRFHSGTYTRAEQKWARATSVPVAPKREHAQSSEANQAYGRGASAVEVPLSCVYRAESVRPTSVPVSPKRKHAQSSGASCRARPQVSSHSATYTRAEESLRVQRRCRWSQRGVGWGKEQARATRESGEGGFVGRRPS